MLPPPPFAAAAAAAPPPPPLEERLGPPVSTGAPPPPREERRGGSAVAAALFVLRPPPPPSPSSSLSEPEELEERSCEDALCGLSECECGGEKKRFRRRRRRRRRFVHAFLSSLSESLSLFSLRPSLPFLFQDAQRTALLLGTPGLDLIALSQREKERERNEEKSKVSFLLTNGKNRIVVKRALPKSSLRARFVALSLSLSSHGRGKAASFIERGKKGVSKRERAGL